MRENDATSERKLSQKAAKRIHEKERGRQNDVTSVRKLSQIAAE